MAVQRKALPAAALVLATLCAALLLLQQPLRLWAASGGAELRGGAPPTRAAPTEAPHAAPAARAPPPQASPAPSAAPAPASAIPALRVFEGEPTRGEDHVFFLETSCALGDAPAPAPFDSPSGLRLSPRAACALESAAAAHPGRPVYLLHTCPLRDAARAPAYARAALALPNVRLWPVRYARLFAASPLEPLLKSGALSRSLWPVVHASDVLRFLVVWKYGGTYFDQDVLMLRSLGEEKNFGCAESSLEVSVGAFNFAWDEAGRKVANACIDALQDFHPELWSYNGPGAITRALKKVCQVDEVIQMTPRKCSGFHLLPTSAFYAVPWQDWKLYFSEDGAEQTMRRINGSMAAHVWNALSHDTAVNTSSQQPYAQIARHVCPRVLAAVGDTM